jgi:hypothetical protein
MDLFYWLRGPATTFTERKDCYRGRDRDADGLLGSELALPLPFRFRFHYGH